MFHTITDVNHMKFHIYMADSHIDIEIKFHIDIGYGHIDIEQFDRLKTFSCSST
jgi:hypothetical protein